MRFHSHIIHPYSTGEMSICAHGIAEKQLSLVTQPAFPPGPLSCTSTSGQCAQRGLASWEFLFTESRLVLIFLY